MEYTLALPRNCPTNRDLLTCHEPRTPPPPGLKPQLNARHLPRTLDAQNPTVQVCVSPRARLRHLHHQPGRALSDIVPKLMIQQGSDSDPFLHSVSGTAVTWTVERGHERRGLPPASPRPWRGRDVVSEARRVHGRWWRISRVRRVCTMRRTIATRKPRSSYLRLVVGGRAFEDRVADGDQELAFDKGDGHVGRVHPANRRPSQRVPRRGVPRPSSGQWTMCAGRSIGCCRAEATSIVPAPATVYTAAVQPAPSTGPLPDHFQRPDQRCVENRMQLAVQGTGDHDVGRRHQPGGPDGS